MIQPVAAMTQKLRGLVVPMLLVASAFALLPSAPAEARGGTTYVLFSQGRGSVTMSGSTEELDRARAYRSGGEAMLYVRDGGASYVIRDAATVRRAAAIFAPQEALGARQAELGSRQAALGSRQASLGAQQARLAGLQVNAPARRVEELARQQEALGRQQDQLRRQQDALGRQQGVLGREQARLAREAESKLRALVAQAIRSGAARRVD